MDRLSTAERWGQLRPFVSIWGILLLAFETVVAIWEAGQSRYYDFRSFYAAGYLLRTHRSDLYSLGQQKWVQDHLIAANVTLPFFSPAYEALLFAPFSLTSYRTAFLLFMALNMVLVLAAFLITQDTFRECIPLWQPRPGLMLLVFFPLLIAVLHGQVSVLLLLVCCATWNALARGRLGLGGLILAVGLFKFNLILPIALIVSLRWGRRFIAGFVSGAIAVAGISVLLVGARGMVMLANLLRAGSLAVNHGTAAQLGTAVFPMRMSSLFALVYVTTRSLHSPGVTFGLTMLLSAVVLIVCARAVRRERRDGVAFSIAVLCGLLVSYHLYLHDLTLLLLPLALLREIARRRELMLASYALPVILVCFVSTDFLFLLTLLPLWALWLAVRSREQESRSIETREQAGATA